MIIGVIPARYGSTRLPGKMLLEFGGKPVLWHTWNRARQATRLDRLVIAAGDEMIAKAARSWGAEVIEVFEECQSGSDRVWQAYLKLSAVGDQRSVVGKSEIRNPISEIIVNIQGDEVQLDPRTVDAVLERLLADPEAGVGTAAAPIESPDDYLGSAIVKVVLDANGRALYFSRAPIPYGLEISSFILHPPPSLGAGSSSFLRHIGIYAYRREALELFTKLPPGCLELTERLEQLRLLEQGVKYAVVVVERAGVEVNTAEDLERVRGEEIPFNEAVQ